MLSAAEFRLIAAEQQEPVHFVLVFVAALLVQDSLTPRLLAD